MVRRDLCRMCLGLCTVARDTSASEGRQPHLEVEETAEMRNGTSCVFFSEAVLADAYP